MRLSPFALLTTETHHFKLYTGDTDEAKRRLFQNWELGAGLDVLLDALVDQMANKYASSGHHCGDDCEAATRAERQHEPARIGLLHSHALLLL